MSAHFDKKFSSFRQAYLKVERANKHIKQLESLVTPLDNRLFRIRWVRGDTFPGGYGCSDENPSSEVHQLIYEPIVPIPEVLSLYIGDAIHNLRAALDYAATAVVRQAGVSTFRASWPFHEKRDDLVPKSSTPLRVIRSALPDAEVEQFFQDVVESHRSGNFPLWAISKLDNIDKHDALIPSVAINNIIIPKLSIGSSSISECVSTFDARRPMAIVTGRMKPDEVGRNVTALVEITFPNESLFGDEPVITTLKTLVKVTLEALQKFDQFVFDVNLSEMEKPDWERSIKRIP